MPAHPEYASENFHTPPQRPTQTATRTIQPVAALPPCRRQAHRHAAATASWPHYPGNAPAPYPIQWPRPPPMPECRVFLTVKRGGARALPCPSRPRQNRQASTPIHASLTITVSPTVRHGHKPDPTLSRPLSSGSLPTAGDMPPWAMPRYADTYQ